MSDSIDDEEDGPLVYPQPSSPSLGKSDGDTRCRNIKPYRYIRHEEVEGTFFAKNNSSSNNNDDSDGGNDRDLPLETLVWVLLSKGKNKVPKLHKRARVSGPMAPETGRVPVRYPNASTYGVRRANLVPVLEHQARLVMVASETNDYRRMSIVHTRRDDHFIEIGCDFGILVDKVDGKSSLGIDKSEESIRIARDRYPHQKFLLMDVFEEGEEELRNLLPQRTEDDGGGEQNTGDDDDDEEDDVVNHLVVAIDINGNRELPAVLRCIQLVLDLWSPRLVVVKSRALYAKMVRADGRD